MKLRAAGCERAFLAVNGAVPSTVNRQTASRLFIESYTARQFGEGEGIGDFLRVLTAIAIAWFLAPTQALAQSDAFPFGDPKVGRKVLEAKCSGCHVARWGGDGSGVFKRQDRKASSTQSLLAWVQRCNANAKLDLNAEEEESIAAYLNEAYYKFKK